MIRLTLFYSTIILIFIFYTIIPRLQYLFNWNESIHLLYNSTIIGGFLSGSMHALTGSDHMAALLPLIFNRRWWHSACIGMIWGMGHGCTSSFIGCLSYSMKSYFVQYHNAYESYKYIINLVIGMTLMYIGIMGYYESLSNSIKEASKEEHSINSILEDSSLLKETNISNNMVVLSIDNVTNTLDNSLFTKPKQTCTLIHHYYHYTSYYRNIATIITVFINGLLMGISWDGLPSLAPSLVINQTSSLIRFLASYTIGTMILMGLASGLVGEGTCWIHQQISDTAYTSDINISERLAVLSSFVAFSIGLFWVCISLIQYYTHYHQMLENNDGTMDPINNHHIHIDMIVSSISIISVVGVVIVAIYKEFGLILCSSNTISITKKTNVHVV